jgi:hypothetical protein
MFRYDVKCQEASGKKAEFPKKDMKKLQKVAKKSLKKIKKNEKKNAKRK